MQLTTRTLPVFILLLIANLTLSVYADVHTLTLDKPAKFDGLLFHNNQLYGAAGWDGSLIQSINKTGQVRKIGVIPRGPIDMVADADGNLLVTSYGSNKVYRLNIQTGEKNVLVTLPSFAGSIINYRSGEYLVGSGSRLYWINELGDFEVYVKDLDQIDNPTGLVMDSQGRIYVGNLSRSTILKIDDATREITTLAKLPNGGQHNIGKLVIHNGILYASHLSHNVIYSIDVQTGDFQLFAGQISTTGQTDGRRQAATFDAPNGLALDETRSELWVAKAYGSANYLRVISLQE